MTAADLAPDTHAAPAAVRVERNPSPTPVEERTEALRAPSFGRRFTDHMVLADWSADRGWRDARVVPLGTLPMHPASSVLHYGQEIFEGLKIYRHADGALYAFRPEMNARRLQRSAERLALPVVPEQLFLDAIDALVREDADWVPPGEGQSLYLRPYVIASEPALGVRASEEAIFGVIASPAGAYFDAADDGVSLWLSTEYSRAGRGGTGAAKCGGNYAASLLAQGEAQEHGCAQVLFTDAETRTWVEEAGSMNIFFAFADGTVVTPPASGTILEGVTRDSILALAPSLGLRTEVRPVSVDEWAERAANGELTEVFASGTAAVITPIGRLVTPDRTIVTPVAGFGPVARRLHSELTGIQFGTVSDRLGWLRRVGARS